MRVTKNESIALLILALVPAVCLSVFALPQEAQNTLKLQTQQPNPATLLTSAFVHGSADHLTGNLVVFELFGFLLLILNKNAGNTRFLVISMVFMTVLLPIIYNLSFILLVEAVFGASLSSFGLSILASGFVGLTVPSLIALYKHKLKTGFGAQTLALGLIFLTSAVIVYPYSTNTLNLLFFASLLLSGACLLFSSFYKTLVTIEKRRLEEVKIVVLLLLSAVVYFMFLTGLFPAVLVQAEGSIVNIFAHYFGVLVGILPAIAYLLKSEERFLP